jgi:hypothetical protein
MAREFTVRKVRSKEDRKRPSVFTSLKVDEQFVAHAMFEPDPELDDNPGYFEYYSHWDQSVKQNVPCAGDDCPFCRINDNPWTRAITVWYYPDNAAGDQLKLFGISNKTINMLAAEAEEEAGLLGKKVRVKRLSDKGDYSVRTRNEKPLTETQMKKLLPLVEELDLEAFVQRQLRAQMERIAAMEALEDDSSDDEIEEEEVPVRARRGQAVAEEEEIEEEEDADSDVDATQMTHSEADEDDDEEDDDEEESEEETEEESEEAPAVSGEYAVIAFSEENETVSVKLNGKTTKFYVGEGVEVDYDDLVKGVMVNLQAIQDEEEDWVITSFEMAGAAPESEDDGEKPARRRARRAR